MSSLRTSFLLPLLLVPLLLGGCRWQSVRVVIPDFGSAGVQGVRLWKAIDGSGEFAEDGVFVFTGTSPPSGGSRQVFYRFASADGTVALPISTTAVLSGDLLLVELHYPTSAEPALYRISTWNEAGESHPSNAIQL
ncbi:MAG: hypothetical protein HKP30_18015 [Myxococcales bacterium]|nr:hypothetical protein [Myxococcales bacterium]